MTITINGKSERLPENISRLQQLTEHKSIPVQGTAIALNGKLIKSDKWPVTNLSEGDILLVISAAYGG